MLPAFKTITSAIYADAVRIDTSSQLAIEDQKKDFC